MMFPKKLNFVQFKIEVGADSYRTENRMCTKSYGDSFGNLYSARKGITLIVEVANAGGAHMILVVLTVSLIPTA
jgi:hypothetical protein